MLVLAIFAVVANTLIWLALKNQPGISAENGPMENFQLVCLFLGFLLWLTASVCSKKISEKIFLVTLALFSVSFFILEIDTRDFDMPLVNKFIRGKYRNGALILFWLGAAIAFLRHKKACWSEFLTWLKTASAACMMASGVFWIISGLNDKHLLGRKDLYREELMEVNATLLMLLAAILFLRGKKKSVPEEIV